MTSPRPSNWPLLLSRFIEERRHTPFDWRRNNCAFFACDWIWRLMGIDPAAPYRPKVASALSAARALNAAGGVERIAAAVCGVNGWPEATPARARRGDVVAFDTSHGLALGVCLGVNAAFASRFGLVFAPTAECTKAWRIG